MGRRRAPRPTWGTRPGSLAGWGILGSNWQNLLKYRFCTPFFCGGGGGGAVVGGWGEGEGGVVELVGKALLVSSHCCQLYFALVTSAQCRAEESHPALHKAVPVEQCWKEPPSCSPAHLQENPERSLFEKEHLSASASGNDLCTEGPDNLEKSREGTLFLGIPVLLHPVSLFPQ